MTYQELVAEVQACASKMDAKAITDHLAVQFNVEGEAEGIFYLEISSGHITVAPYDYHDNDFMIFASAKQVLDIFKGKLDPAKALSQGKIYAEGNIGRIGLLNEIIKKTPEKKTAAKKPAAKKVAAKKAEVKTKVEEKKTEEKAKVEEKKAAVAEKKTAAKAKVEEKKTEVKAKVEEKKAAVAEKKTEVAAAATKTVEKKAPAKK